MDKRTILAFVLIALVFLAWSFLFAPKPEPPSETTGATASTTTPPPPVTPIQPPQPPETRLGERYAAHLQGEQRYITIESPLYTAILNTRGGLLARFQLKNYTTWYGDPVQLISDSTGFPGELGISYTAADGRVITTEDLMFQIDAPEKVTIGENDSVVVTARLALSDSSSTVAGAAVPTIEKRFVFRGDDYGIGFDVMLHDMASEMGSGTYDILWAKGLKYQEHNSVGESGAAKAYAMAAGDLNEVDASSIDEPVEKKFTGQIDWVGTNVKYFGMALIPSQPLTNTVATIAGSARGADSSGIVEDYSVRLSVPAGQSGAQSFTIFLGPLDYDVLSAYNLQAMLNIGARFVIRPIGEFVLLPVFRFLHSFIGNYGVVIIVFSLLIRLLLWPLSIPQIKSSRKMQLLQPEIAKMRERFKDDPQKQQMETMSMYREYGINPMGGCLPMVLQLPILYALWNTLSSAIELRQAGFMLWIHDLSIPDVVMQLPFSIPLLGDKLSGLALIMGATLFLQQKMMITDPKQKAMVYFMPILLTLAFNHLPSGLNLYYLTFNILSIGQQLYITKFSKNTLTLEQMRKESKNKKKGWLAQKLEEAQKMAELQQKKNPGGKKVDGRTPVEPRRPKS